MQKRNVLNSPRLLELKRQRQKVFRNKALLCLSAFLAVFALLTYLSRIPAFNINGVEITGNKVIDTETIKTIVQTQIEGNYLWLFPKTNVLLYPKNKIINELYDQFKRIKHIDLSVKNKKTLEVSITERTALYTWCGAVLPDVSTQSDNTQKCYFMDADGYIFDEAPYFSGEVYFKFYGLTNVTDNAPSGSYFSQKNFQKLILLKEAFKNMGLKPIGLYVENNGDAKILLSRGSGSQTAPEIIFKIDSDFDKVAENLQAAITTEPLQSSLKNKYSSLLYIDLRFGNKVYYKFR
jgi:hypothetical protein